MIEFEQTHILPHALITQFHTDDGATTAMVFDYSTGLHDPVLQQALGEFNNVLSGMIIRRMRGTIQNTVPPSMEGVEVGFCKVCKDPVASNEQGIRRNGQLFYCPKHSSTT